MAPVLVEHLVYVANIQRALNPTDSGAWFGHVWTLSLEEQFALPRRPGTPCLR